MRFHKRKSGGRNALIRLFAGCKLNLGLRVTGIRPDGYHELATLFYPLDWPRDEIQIEFKHEQGLTLDCPQLDIPAENNLLSKTWRAFKNKTGSAPGVALKLIKRIPSGAGLGGGSSDAATFLLWLNHIQREPLKQEELKALALELGADVPFFLENRPCYAEGIGECLEPVCFEGAGYTVLIVDPAITISAAWAYKALDEKGLTKIGPAARKSACVEVADLDLRNDLEGPVFERWPVLRALKKEILSLGAIASAMSGSGSVIYGIFSDQAVANHAAIRMRRKWRATYLVAMRNFGM